MNDTLRFPDEFALVDGCFVPRDSRVAEFDYSDGETTERAILRELNRAADRSSSSSELGERIRDWPTRYHFSALRANVLRPFNVGKYDHVLEIGSGCGAITRYLGESCRKVVAIEGSPQRAAATRARCRDLDNVSCICANLQDISFTEPFDLVVVIGVLEYANRFYTPSGQSPWLRFLNDAAATLAPDGTVILAIENQYGLKYFAGCPEDHLGVPYIGVEGYSKDSPVRTFSRSALISLFREADLEPELYLPFPDYKLPEVIINARSASLGLELGQWFSRDMQDTSISIPLLLPEAERNGLLPDLANSFIVKATRSGRSAPEDWHAVSFASNRAPEFRTQTTLFGDGDSLRIKKERLINVAASPLDDWPEDVQSSRYIRGDKLSLSMLRAIRLAGGPSSPQFESLLDQWHAFLMEHAITGSDRALPQLPSDYVDCIPQNLIANDGQLVYFDAEWNSDGGTVALPWVLFRGLLWFILGYQLSLDSTLPRPSWQQFVRRCLSRYGYRSTSQVIRAYCESESQFQNKILPTESQRTSTAKMLKDFARGRVSCFAARALRRGSRFRHRVAQKLKRTLFR